MDVRPQAGTLSEPKAVPRRRWDDVPGAQPITLAPEQVIRQQRIRVQAFLVLLAAGALTMGVSAALLQQQLLTEGGLGLLVSLFLFSRGFRFSSRRDRRRTDPKEGLR